MFAFGAKLAQIATNTYMENGVSPHIEKPLCESLSVFLSVMVSLVSLREKRRRRLKAVNISGR
jgi:hypothetical protein